MNRHVLEGCSPTPASSYLKGLGIMRILAEQRDPEIRMCWDRDRAVLMTHLSRGELLQFVLDEYDPTPIVTPWSYNKYCKASKIYEKLVNEPRFERYRETLRALDLVLEDLRTRLQVKKLGKSHVDNAKADLLRVCRNRLPDYAVEWLDAVYVIVADTAQYAPILGSGGNDGNFDLAENFAKKLQMLIIDEYDKKSPDWLEAALFGNVIPLDAATTMGHNPDGSGGPNSSMGFDGASLSNPWGYVLMLEGSILFGGSVARRHSTSADKAIFPFTTDAANVGYATASEGEEGRGEIWLPLWKNPATYSEIKHVFSEGRVDLNGRQAKTGVEFARAIASFGTERGITEFQQFCIVQRKGRDHLTVNAGRMRVADEPAVRLLAEMDSWYGPIVRQSKSKEAPVSLRRLVRNMDDAIVRLCKYREPSYLQEILVLIGKLERYVTDRGDLRPLQSLSSAWLDRCYDGTAEFRLAASVASIGATDDVGHIRTNLENVAHDKYYNWTTREDSTSCVWNENDNLPRNMSRVLLRRGIDAKMNGADKIPTTPSIHARIDDIAKFLDGSLDLGKIGRLVHPLSLIKNPDNYPWKGQPADRALVPEAYAIVKLAYHPANQDIPFDMSALNMLAAGRINDAYARASYMLNSHGLRPRRYSRRGGVARDAALPDSMRQRMAASLLFGIHKDDVKLLRKQVIVDKDTL